jgi:hypothetical protein
VALPPIATAPNLTPLPKLPEPNEAKGIVITGIIEVGGVPTAIVKAPNEPSRSVREGDRIANGQVLVKRIDLNRGPNPVVILEQYGQEIAKGIGERPSATAESPATPRASLPAPTAVNLNISAQG